MTVAELALADRGIQRTPGHPDQVCALYFTSGSTGTPKAVTCTHRGWVNRIWWMQRRHGLAAGETVLQKTTLTFDDAAVEMFWPLLAGGRVAMLEPGGHRDPRAILDGAARYRAVHINFVPGMLEMVLDAVRPEELPALSTLRSLVSCGDVLRPELVGRVFECFNGQVMLDNLWGATEVSIDSTWLQCGEDETRPTVSGAVCLGRPFDNNDVLVLDDEGRPVPPGVAGELCIGGVGLARGYHADPARTARTFVPHPHRPGERMYCTGDQGRRRTNGLIEFRGRRDDQVKVRGVRIELGEVDAALRAHPDVVDVAVIAWQAAPGDKRLAAYAVTRNRAATTAADLRRFASERLAVYAVPSSIALLDELPRLPSGKLDRRRLPAAEPDADRETGYQPPTGPAEEAIAAIWRDVLSLARVGRDDNFFTIGGHSLLAIRALTKTRQTFDLALPVSMMFDKPTVAAAAAHVEDLLRAEIAALTDDEVARLLPQEPAAG
jgi:amino acid adenylation domain-containing protein